MLRKKMIFSKKFQSFLGFDSASEKKYHFLKTFLKYLKLLKVCPYELILSNRHNYVLLDQQMQRALDLIITHREQCGVLPENKYVFALSSSVEGFIRHSTELRKLRLEIGVKNVSTTQMRKYLATSFQVRYFLTPFHEAIINSCAFESF